MLLSQSTLLIVFYQQKVNKNEMFQQITVNTTNEIYQSDSLKVTVLSYSSKGAITGSKKLKELSKFL